MSNPYTGPNADPGFFPDARAHTASTEINLDPDGLVHIVVKRRQVSESGRSWSDIRAESTMTPEQFARAAAMVAEQAPLAQRRYIDIRRRPDAPDPAEMAERLLRDAEEEGPQR